MKYEMFRFTRRIGKKNIIITHYAINNKNYMTYIERTFIVGLQQ